tara:strand:+ start:481 stop:600 length:120 start_codon:yes stop_codon:yes gene_type:complete
VNRLANLLEDKNQDSAPKKEEIKRPGVTSFPGANPSFVR